MKFSFANFANKDDKFPFIIRIVIILIAIYVGVMLAATWIVKNEYSDDISDSLAKKITDIKSQLQICKYTNVKSSA